MNSLGIAVLPSCGGLIFQSTAKKYNWITMTLMPTPICRLLLRALLWLAVVCVAVFVYWPGLHGPFLFDDFGNVDKLGALGGIRDWDTFKAFVFGGAAGPSGRPVTLVTFAMNAQSWPASPLPFKITNLIIHLLNGLLIFLICKIITSVLEPSGRDNSFYVALTVAALWLVHPFLVSTTLYVVQRMAQLAALFCLLGVYIHVWLRARPNLSITKFYVLITLNLGICFGLALFSKENGALLPVLILVLELSVFSALNDKNIKWYGFWRFAFLIIPAASMLGYLVWLILDIGLFNVITHRGYSLYERLLTESRIVFEYLQLWFIPQLYTAGVFQDAYPKSVGLLQPISTIATLIFHSVVLLGLVVVRKRLPIVAFSGLFFYTSHLIESTAVPLELYFEHRNYLGAGFLFFPIVFYLYKAVSIRLCVLVLALWFSLLGAMTLHVSKIWSSYDSMVLSWAQLAPNSSRAQQQASMLLFNRGSVDDAIRVANNAVANKPEAFDLRLWQLVVTCMSGVVDPADVDMTISLATKSKYDVRAIEYYNALLDAIRNKGCDNLGLPDAYALISALLSQPSNANPRTAQYAQIQYLLGIIRVYENDVEAGWQHFDKSLAARSSPDVAMRIAGILASETYYAQALEFAEKAKGYVLRGNLGVTGRSQQVFLQELTEFELIVKRDLEGQSN